MFALSSVIYEEKGEHVYFEYRFDPSVEVAVYSFTIARALRLKAPGRGGDYHMEWMEMLVGNFEFNS